MRSRLLKFIASFPLLILAVAIQATPAHAYTNSHLIDDAIFDNTNSMSTQSIQSWLSSNYPNGCLTNYQAPDPQSWSGYGGNVSAAQVINDAAHIWGINPQVLLATLEKEEGLVSGHGAYGCSQTAFNSAMGYDCPGPIQPATGTCVAHTSNLGFSAQVSHGGWQLEFGRYRSEGDGNLGYDGDGNITYYGYMTQGTRPRVQGGASQFYSGNITLDDGTNLNVENGATASLYSYTPFLQSFSRIFEQFFGVGSTSVSAYQWQFMGQDSNINLWGIPAGQEATLTVHAKNTGSATWTNSGSNPVRISASHPNDRSSDFRTSAWLSTSRAATLQESSVAPGATGTFIIPIQVPNEPGVHNEYFNLLAEGITWMNDPGLYFSINVVPDQLVATITGNSLPTSLDGGTLSSSVTITARNDGNETWYHDGNYPVSLGTSSPNDRSSPFYDSGTWTSASRLAHLNESSVAPGSSGTFTFKLNGPLTPGSYNEHYSLVADRLDWFSSQITAPINVRGTYTATPVSQPTVTVTAGGSTSVTLSFTNTGSATWNKTGTNPVHLGAYSPIDRTSAFCDPSWINCSRPASLNETTVAPGGTGTFTFTLQSLPSQNGTYHETFLPVAEQLAWFGTPATVTINVQPVTFSYSLSSLNVYTDSSKATPLDTSQMSPGQTGWVVAQVTNTGSATWNKTGTNPVHLGAYSPIDRTSAFCDPSWINCSRPASLNETTVAPGGTGTFEFPISAPAQGTNYNEHFDLLAEKIAWMTPSPGLAFNAHINNTYSWSLTSQYAYTDSTKTTPANIFAMTTGQTAYVGFTARNTGTATWYNSGRYPLNVGASHPLDRVSQFSTTGWINPSRPAHMTEASVPPGGVGTFEFNFKAPIIPGLYPEYFDLLSETNQWLPDPGLYFYAKVN